ncbi:MAG: DUF975 family protein [Lachnospiraceae bacterium]|nr:DUF975 family protein [Lachnospiraceae bacterium]
MSKTEGWKNSEIKALGVTALKRSFKMCVIASFFMSLYVPLAAAVSASGRNIWRSSGDSLGEKLFDLASTMATGGTPILVLKLMGINGVVLVMLNVVIFNALQTGCARFFLKNSTENASADDIGWIFKERYFTALLANLFVDVIITITGTLLFFPALVARYSYILTSYIIADEEDISWIKALRRSRMMMRGRKWKYFVYDLTFIGWMLISMATLGLAGVFFYNPYKDCADAELYRKIKADYEKQAREKSG